MLGQVLNPVGPLMLLESLKTVSFWQHLFGCYKWGSLWTGLLSEDSLIIIIISFYHHYYYLFQIHYLL